jgi:hypothetical protein
VSVTAAGGVVTLTVQGAGPVDATYLQDRAGAVGGELDVAPDGLRAVIPCASSSLMTTS